jgi:hypothetical protein
MPTFHVYYRKKFNSFVKVDDYRAQDYVGVGCCHVDMIEEVWYHFQGEVWSPNGEQREHIQECGTDHTSMSCGDMLIDPKGVSWMCMPFGWEIIPDRFRTE